MKGLLHRVAARAAGTAAVVRSDSVLPYAGADSGLTDISGLEVGYASATTRGSLVPAAPGSPMPAVRAASAAHEPAREVQTLDLADPLRAMGAAVTPPAVIAARTDAEAVRDAPRVMLPARFVSPVASIQPSAVEQLQAFMMPVLPVPLLQGAVPSVAQREPEPAKQAPRETAINERMALRVDEPVPLMPREARPAPLAPLPQPAIRRGAVAQGLAAPQSEPDTEVHIHIGRIDVTAVKEAPAPRRSAAAAPAPMSLDGYLAQRGRS